MQRPQIKGRQYETRTEYVSQGTIDTISSVGKDRAYTICNILVPLRATYMKCMIHMYKYINL